MVDAATPSERMLDGAFEFIGLLSPTGTLLDANRSTFEFFGVERAAVLGRPVWDPPWVESSEQAEQLREAVRRAAAGEFVRTVLRRHARDGRLEEIDFSLSCLRGAGDDERYLVAEGRLVTGLIRAVRNEPAAQARMAARVRALADAARARMVVAGDRAPDEQVSWHSERAYRAAFQTGLPKAEVDYVSGSILSVNQRFADFVGVKPQELRGTPLSQLFSDDSYATVQTACADLHREPRRPRVVRVGCVTAREKTVPVEIVLSAVDRGPGEQPTTCLVSLQDMSRLDTAERRRASAEALTAALVASAVDGIMIVDTEGHIELFNPAASRLFGFAFDEVVGQTIDILVPAGSQEPHGAYIRRFLETGNSNVVGRGREVQGRRKDGSVFPLFLSVSAMDVGGERRFACIAHDLSALKQAQSEAVRERERFELAARGSVDALWEWRAEPRGEFYLSDRFWELLGYGRRELPNTLDTFASLVHPEDRDMGLRALRERLASRAPFVFEMRLRRKSGEYRWFRGHGFAVWGESGLPARMAGSLSDITEELEVKEQLAEQRTLAELGKMAAVVVHEVRNPIAGVQGALDVLIARRAEGDEERDIMLKMRRRLDSLSEMVGDLLVYSRPRPVTLRPTALSEVLDSLQAIAATTPAAAHVTLVVSPCSLVIDADEQALGRVLLNLVLNAAQAMSGRGRIEVTTTEGDETVAVEVVDSGPGMSAETLNRLFEPFFTTKKGGSGLGLAIARRIVEQHKGTLTVHSVLGKGTRVHVRLPKTLRTQEVASLGHTPE